MAVALDEDTVGVDDGDGLAGHGFGAEAGGVELCPLSLGAPDGAVFAVDRELDEFECLAGSGVDGC
ncbi:MAG: hypothetical protein ACT4NY_18655 [Pseudonocardiales bacterium]